MFLQVIQGIHVARNIDIFVPALLLLKNLILMLKNLSIHS